MNLKAKIILALSLGGTIAAGVAGPVAHAVADGSSGPVALVTATVSFPPNGRGLNQHRPIFLGTAPLPECPPLC
jgi:hypothetical protein